MHPIQFVVEGVLVYQTTCMLLSIGGGDCELVGPGVEEGMENASSAWARVHALFRKNAAAAQAWCLMPLQQA